MQRYLRVVTVAHPAPITPHSSLIPTMITCSPCALGAKAELIVSGDRLDRMHADGSSNTVGIRFDVSHSREPRQLGNR